MSGANVIQLADRRPPTVQVVFRDVYGTQMCYPANEEAHLFAALTKKKTLDSADRARIEQLGFRIDVVQTQVRI